MSIVYMDIIEKDSNTVLQIIIKSRIANNLINY